MPEKRDKSILLVLALLVWLAVLIFVPMSGIASAALILAVCSARLLYALFRSLGEWHHG